MFIQKSDYFTYISEEELDVISGNDLNRQKAEKSAITKISHVLSRQFDTETIFNKEGDDRDTTILEYTIYYALYILFGKIAKSKVPDDRYAQYMEAKDFFQAASKDEINTNLPRKQTILGDKEGSPSIRFGSDSKYKPV